MNLPELPPAGYAYMDPLQRCKAELEKLNPGLSGTTTSEEHIVLLRLIDAICRRVERDARNKALEDAAKHLESMQINNRPLTTVMGALGDSIRSLKESK